MVFGGGFALQALDCDLAPHGHLIGEQHLAHAALAQQLAHVHRAPARLARCDGLQQLERALGGLVGQQARLDGALRSALDRVGVHRERAQHGIEGLLRGFDHGQCGVMWGRKGQREKRLSCDILQHTETIDGILRQEQPF